MIIDGTLPLQLIVGGACPGVALCIVLTYINGPQFLEDAMGFGLIFGCSLLFIIVMAITVGPRFEWGVLYLMIFGSVGVFAFFGWWEKETELEHQRTLAAKRREQEQILADRGVFNADQGLMKQQKLRDLHEKRWYAVADAARATEAIRAAEYLAAENPDPNVAQPDASLLSALEQQRDELQEKLQEATADGRGDEITRLGQDIAAIERTIVLIKKASA